MALENMRMGGLYEAVRCCLNVIRGCVFVTEVCEVGAKTRRVRRYNVMTAAAMPGIDKKGN